MKKILIGLIVLIGISYGGLPNVVVTNGTAVTASSLLIAASDSRKGLYIQNTSGTEISISFGQAAVLNDIVLVDNASWSDSGMIEPYTGSVYSISGTTTKNVTVLEFYR